MVRAPLVIPDIMFGEAFLSALDSAHFPLTVALWLKEDEDRWVLVLSTPLYDEVGGTEAYVRLIGALSTEGPIALIDYPIRLESDNDPFVRDLRKKFGKTSSVEGMRLGGHTIGGKWIEDAYVYRVK
ncbi:MAG: hypothetical protein ABIR70_06890 [Bryobacteraceae bacterium]